MKFTILIPHYRNGMTTAYAVSQFLKFKGRHDVYIVVIDNSYPDKSIEMLKPFEDIHILPHRSNKLSSHGIALEMATNIINSEWFIAAESDSFPTQENWLDYYEDLIKQGYDCAGSLLQLSGGEYVHPCGMLYRKSVWEHARNYCLKTPYQYYPNMAMKNGFASHLMVHKSIVDQFLEFPQDYVELSESYLPFSKEYANHRLYTYSSTVCAFHNGMGRLQESVLSYGLRNLQTEVPNILLDEKAKIIYRVGYEPGQFFSYFQLATNRKVFFIPTETKWLHGREGQQQQYTKMENGFTHIWAGSSFLDMKGTDMNDVYEFKSNQIIELYNSLPDNLKIQ